MVNPDSVEFQLITMNCAKVSFDLKDERQQKWATPIVGKMLLEAIRSQWHNCVSTMRNGVKDCEFPHAATA